MRLLQVLFGDERQLAGESVFTFVGNADVKTKTFIDMSIPAGSATASYTIQGIRGGLSGASSFAFEVKFGSAPAAGAWRSLRAGPIDYCPARRQAGQAETAGRPPGTAGALSCGRVFYGESACIGSGGNLGWRRPAAPPA